MNVASADLWARPPWIDAANSFLAKFRVRLRDRRFWTVQAMILAVTAGHFIAEVSSIRLPERLEPMYFLPASLYFFPVLYASLNFGKEGALPTAAWSGLLAIPNVVLFHHGAERVGEAFQLTSVIFLASIVATRVDREIEARRRAETQEQARRASELKYHSLFDNTGQAIVLVDSSGRIQESNAAASLLFRRDAAQLKGTSLVDAVGEAGIRSITQRGRRQTWSGPEFLFQTPRGELWLEPQCASLPGEGADMLVVLLKDVTARHGIQSYAREIVRAQEDERQRIARDLHDVSLQSIVLLCRRLDEVEEEAGGEMPAAASAALSRARQMAEGIGADLRRFSRDLRPPVLDDLGLVPALRGLLDELSAHSETHCRFVLRGSPFRLAPACELSLFRIAQESIRNVERHADATSLTATLSFGRDRVTLSVLDNGKGFELPESMATLASGGRLGVLGMQERAHLIGGSFRISSRPGKGTRVSVSLPAGPVSGDASCPQVTVPLGARA
jgi:PAS domain S-box-containing protein